MGGFIIMLKIKSAQYHELPGGNIWGGTPIETRDLMPGGPASDRSMEMLDGELKNLQVAIKGVVDQGVLDPQAQQQLWQAYRTFEESVIQIKQSYSA